MKWAIAASVAIGALILCAMPAKADPFEGWTVEQIRAHPDFVAFDTMDYPPIVIPSSATMSANPDAVLAYTWIGEITSRNTTGRAIWYIFDARGDHVTIGGYEYGDYDAPLWVIPALEYLTELGFLNNSSDSFEFTWMRLKQGFDPDARLKAAGLL